MDDLIKKIDDLIDAIYALVDVIALEHQEREPDDEPEEYLDGTRRSL